MASKARRIRLVPLLLFVLLVVFAARNWEEGPRMVEALERVRPEWLLLAIVFQIATYVSVGFAYKILGSALRTRIPLGAASRMAVVNLFVNSAIPSAGLSGNFFLVSMMNRAGVPPGTSGLVVLLERVLYFAALVVFAIAVAGRVVLNGGAASGKVAVALLAVVLITVGLGLFVRRVLRAPVAFACALARLVARLPRRFRSRLDPSPLVEDARRIEEAGGTARLGAGRLLGVFAAEVALLLFDVLTIWALFRGIGLEPPMKTAAVGYVLATLLAQIVVVPGALEVGLAGLLASLGVRTANAVLVTMLFHFLSLWAAMPFGWFFYRGAINERVSTLRERRSLRADSTRRG